MIFSATTALYIGGTSYSKAYIGSTQVWPSSGGTGYTFTFKYTSQYGTVVNPNSADTWQVISNTYTGGVGTIVVSASTTAIPDYWMNEKHYITSIVIPSGITDIGYRAFYLGTRVLSSVTLPNTLITIGTEAFVDSSFSSLTIPNSVTTIGYDAFKRCSNLKQLSLSNTLSEILDSAFLECTGLTTLTIPKSITLLDSACFGYCSSLSTINYTGTKNEWNSISKATSGYSWNYGVPATVVHCTDGDINL